ncbi:MAG: efflux RND transporter periplasmic adaptor subunit [Rikenellaceae bacterium]
MKKVYLKSLLMLCAASTLASCGSKQEKAASEAQQEETAVLVRTEKSTSGSVSDIAEFTGNIQPYQQNNIAPSMPLRINELLVEVGDNVKKGDLLVTMDKNQYIQSSVQLENYKADLARMQSVYEAGGISKQSLDQMLVQVKVMQEANDNLKENIELRSPIDGVVTSRAYDVGDMYPGSGNILTVMQINPLKVLVDVSEKNYPQLKKGMMVDLKANVYPNETFSGVVNLVYPSINSASHTVTTEILIPNKDQKLRPGMFARTIFNFGEEKGVLVSDLAIQKQQGSNERYAYVVVDGKADRRTLTLGRHLGSYYHVISGINEGEEVVVAGASKLIKGTKVEVKNN